MLIDVEAEASDRSFTSDVCVLGAGVAGLVLASRLAGRGLKVHLLEAGGLKLEDRSQQLYEAEMGGLRHAGTTEGRFRVFGGSSTRWGGQLLPYTPDIFAPGLGIPSAAWPIGPDAVEPYYAEVLRIMGVGHQAASLPFEGAGLLRGLGHRPVEFSESMRLRYSKWAPFGRRNLANSLGKECIESANVTVFLHANAIALEREAGQVRSVRVKNYAGAEFRFNAKEFCVCLGTIESSRLLLASDVGNEHDQAGRYFHDHVGVHVAVIEGAARERILELLGPFFVEGVLHTCKLEAAEGLRERMGLPAVMAHVVVEEPEDSGVGAVRGMLRSMQRGDVSGAAKSVGPLLGGLGDVARLLWASKVRGRRAITGRAKVWLNIDMEQVAGPERRIRLSEAMDVLGQRKAVVEWSTGETERRTLERYAPVVREELERLGLGPLRWLDGVLSGDPKTLAMADTFHPMGGLCMGRDPSTSVVDPELTVHGTENVHVASCAVYPGGGSSNPTFTMMALTLRLADRLAVRMV